MRREDCLLFLAAGTTTTTTTTTINFSSFVVEIVAEGAE